MPSVSRGKWRDPLTLLAAADALPGDYALLHSAMPHAAFGRYSYLALFPKKQIAPKNFAALEKLVKHGLWFGYASYEARHTLENLPKSKPTALAMPPLCFTQFGLVVRFDHHEKKIRITADSTAQIKKFDALTAKKSAAKLPAYKKITSNMTKQKYLGHVKNLRTQIRDGIFYQANLTRKFFAEFAADLPAPAIFTALMQKSPTPFGALMRIGKTYILSSSPELFLEVEKGRAMTKPIKGTARRGKTAQQDAALAGALAASPKERAENLMIVDLMRNDFSRVCKPGSIRVPALYALESYATVHHLVSTVGGRLPKNKNAVDLLKACFPPGSMTGTPKIKAMEILTPMEKLERGVYSGAIGMLQKNSAMLSVVIRTLLIRGKRCEFQVGGGITADSAPTAEWEETLAKATALAAVLGLSEKDLRAL